MSELFPERIETDRLELTAMTTETVDAMEYYRVCSGQAAEAMGEVTENLTWDPHETPKETVAFLELVERKRADEDGTEYLIRPKEGEDGAGEIAGATGLSVDWDRRTGTLGMWLRKPFWGRGYSGERAAALMELAFERLDLELVAVTHVVGNEKSRRAVEKYVDAHGGSHDGRLRNWDATGDEPRDLHRYTVSAEEYEEATASGR
jgi:ribosomal-protein-alanine N-acetyltransferase